MGLRKLAPLRFLWVLAIMACFLAPTMECQLQGCSIEGIDMGMYLNERNSSFSIDSACCKVLHKAVKMGYNCLCSLVASSRPILNIPLFSLLLSKCHISVPPLTLCRVLAPIPIVFPPPNSPNEPTTQPSLPPKDVPVSPPHEMQLSFNSTRNNNSTIVAIKPSNENVDPPVSPPETQVSSASAGETNTTMAATQPTSSANSSESTLSKKEGGYQMG